MNKIVYSRSRGYHTLSQLRLGVILNSVLDHRVRIALRIVVESLAARVSLRQLSPAVANFWQSPATQFSKSASVTSIVRDPVELGIGHASASVKGLGGPAARLKCISVSE